MYVYTEKSVDTDFKCPKRSQARKSTQTSEVLYQQISNGSKRGKHGIQLLPKVTEIFLLLFAGEKKLWPKRPQQIKT